MSLANNLVFETKLSDKSAIYIQKSRDPRIQP